MSEAKQRVDVQYLRRLVPVCELTADNLATLAQKTFIERLSAGQILFRQGDKDNFSYYLLSGEVSLRSDIVPEKVIKGGSVQARFPLDHHRPRQATAYANNDIRYIKVDNDLLDIMLTWDQNTGYMVAEIGDEEEENNSSGDENDWMTHLLRSSLFHRIPATNIQAMFMRMEEMPVRRGDVVIRQGAEGDYYYYISKGRCVVTRKSAKTGKQIKLAELEPGSGFGEEALISGAKRNANVAMLTDGVLMRLGKADFEALLKQPILKKVNYEQAVHMVKNEGVLWLDVRLESEHKNVSIPGSLNIPLYLLRIKSSMLEKDKTYITYCDTGRRSSSAAYLLSERGFEAYVLEGGLMALKHNQTSNNG